MSGLKVLILDMSEGKLPWVDTLTWCTLEAWRGNQHRTLHKIELHELELTIHPSTDQVVWLITDANTDEVLVHRVANQVVDLHCPVLLTRENESMSLGDEYDPGVFIGPPDSEPEELALVLNALAVVAPVLKFRGHELRLTRKTQSGIRGEITRIDEEMRLAAQVQRQFIPKGFPPLERLRFGSLYLPANYVSGDIYDVFRMDEKHVGVFLADAMGHGTPAALMTVFVKRALPTKTVEDKTYRLLEPYEAIERLNEELLGSGEQLNIVTAFYAIINIETMVCRYTLAGHPMPALLRGDGDVVMLDADGPLVGVFEDQKYEQREITLQSRDRLLIFSDGFFDLFLNQDDLSSCALSPDILDFARQSRTDDAVIGLRNKISSLPGSLHQRDDITVLVMTVDEALTAEEKQFTHAIV